MIARTPHHNPSEIIDKLLEDNNGYLVYQEDVIKFLQQICGLTGGEADTVRRGIARKKTDVLESMLPQIMDGYCSKSDKSRAEAEGEAKEFLKIIEDASSYMFGYNHAIAYSLITYLCAWLRAYHPLEFITSYLNHAANDGDIEAGSELAGEYGIQILPPRYGESTDKYFFDREKNVITKGIESIKDLNGAVARELFGLSKTHKTTSFMELLRLMSEHSTLRSNQLDNLIKIGYFEDFGNMPTLEKIRSFYDFFKGGEAKKVKKDKLNPELAEIVSHHASDKNSKGETLVNFTITDMDGLLKECEERVIALGLKDVDMRVKIRNTRELLGYIAVRTGRPEDRCRLIVTDILPLKSKATNTPWAYKLTTQSIGTGKAASLTAYTEVFKRRPIIEGDIIRTSPSSLYKNKKGFWYITDWIPEL